MWCAWAKDDRRCERPRRCPGRNGPARIGAAKSQRAPAARRRCSLRRARPAARPAPHTTRIGRTSATSPMSERRHTEARLPMRLVVLARRGRFPARGSISAPSPDDANSKLDKVLKSAQPGTHRNEFGTPRETQRPGSHSPGIAHRSRRATRSRATGSLPSSPQVWARLELAESTN